MSYLSGRRISTFSTLQELTVDDITVDGNTISSSGSSTLAIIPKAGQSITFDGTITLDAGVIAAATSITSTVFVGDITGDVTGNAATATALASARTIGGVSFDGTGNINLPGVNAAGNQNTSGTAAIATAVTITDNESTDESNAIIFTAGGDVDGGNLGLESDGTLTYNPSTGKVTATGFVGTLTGNVTGNTSGTAATVTTAAQTNITSLGTLTTLTIDSVIINGTTIGHTSDTDLMTLADGVLTVAGELDAATLDISGNADIDGTLEADAYTVDGTTLAEYISDTVGAMVSSNTETGITVTYQDGDNTIDFVVGTLNQDTTGTASLVTVTDSTANTNFPVTFHDESNALLDDTGALRYNPSTGTLLVPNLSVAGTTTTVDTVTMEAANAVIFEGATADGNETTLSIVDPTGDHTQYLINQGGYIPLLAAVTTTAITSTPAELNLLDGSSANSVVNSKAVIYGSSGEVAGTLSTAAQGSVTSLGTLTALTVDDVAVNGKVITMTGSSSDTAVFTAGTNGTLSIVTTDDAAAAANIQITADGTVDIDSAGVLTLDSGAAINIEPASGSAILLDGTISIDAGVITGATSITSTAFVGDITGDVTGNTSGTAATVTTAAQTNITSLGTLTALTVDDVAVNGKVITMTGSSSDTAVFTAGTNGTLSIVTTDAAAAAANITITADGTFEVDGTTITLDSSGDIDLNADGGDVFLKDASTTYGSLTNTSGNLIIKSGTTTALTFSGADVTIAGDLTISGDDLTMGTNTSGAALIADGTNFNPVVISGDISINTSGVAAIGSGVIVVGDMAANSIDSAQYVDGSIDTAHYAAGSVDATALGADAVTAAKIGDNVLNSEHYAAGSIDLEHMSANSVDSDQYVDGSIDVAHMAANSIDSAQYVDGSIDTAHIAADAITAALIADDVINSEHYAAGSIDNEHIADDAINSEHYADGSIDTAHIADDQVTEAKMADDAIGSAQLKTVSTLIIKDSSGGQLKIIYGAGA